MSDSTVEDEYSYPGWLVFNGLFKTSFDEEDEISEDISTYFPEYSEGSPNEPQRGYRVLDLPEKLGVMSELSSETEAFATNLNAFEYVDEDWVENWGYDEQGDETLYYLPQHDRLRIYWNHVEGVLMVKGGKRLMQQKQSELLGRLSSHMNINQISFDWDFFLWILYKQYENEPLSADLRVRNVTRGKTTTETRDNLGAGGVRDSHDILRSILLIAPVLSGKKIEEIQGNFLMGNHQIKAHLEMGGKVHVKVSDSPLSTLSDLRRMGISLRFLSELVNLYVEWDLQDPEDRYPPPSFFDDLAEIAEEEGWGPSFDPQDVKGRYEGKRQGLTPGSSDSARA